VSTPDRNFSLNNSTVKIANGIPRIQHCEKWISFSSLVAATKPQTTWEFISERNVRDANAAQM
jgi:hypothetical protein